MHCEEATIGTPLAAKLSQIKNEAMTQGSCTISANKINFLKDQTMYCTPGFKNRLEIITICWV